MMMEKNTALMQTRYSVVQKLQNNDNMLQMLSPLHISVAALFVIHTLR